MDVDLAKNMSKNFFFDILYLCWITRKWVRPYPYKKKQKVFYISRKYLYLVFFQQLFGWRDIMWQELRLQTKVWRSSVSLCSEYWQTLSAEKSIYLWIPWNLSFRYIHCTGQFTPKMKANAEPRLLSSLVWIDSGIEVSQHRLECFFPK